jgi:hypothetical protein
VPSEVVTTSGTICMGRTISSMVVSQHAMSTRSDLPVSEPIAEVTLMAGDVKDTYGL